MAKSLQLIVFVSLHLLLLLMALAAHKLVGAYEEADGLAHVNVWRGPGYGHKKHKFAPWGYYAKLPADDSHHHKHHHQHHYQHHF